MESSFICPVCNTGISLLNKFCNLIKEGIAKSLFILCSNTLHINVCEFSFPIRFLSFFAYKPFGIDVSQYFLKSKISSNVQWLNFYFWKVQKKSKFMNYCWKWIRTLGYNKDNWVAEFKHVRRNFEDDPRQGRSKTSTDLKRFSGNLGLSLSSVKNILSDVLGFRKLLA